MKSQLHKALTSRFVFACHCSVEDNGIQAGILLLHEDFQPGMHFLYPLDDPTRPIAVEINYQSSPQYQVILPYAAIPSAQVS